jgi:hypothetical protein
MSSDSERLPTLASEHTAKLRSGISHCVVHSRSVWEMREIDGTRKSTFVCCSTPWDCAKRSAIFNVVKVLPVPQAMISLPRSCFSNPESTSSSARTWWGRRRFLILRRSCVGAFGLNCPQSTALWSRFFTRNRVTGMRWSLSASSACLLQWSVVEMIIRLVNGLLPDAVKKESKSAFCRWWSGS